MKDLILYIFQWVLGVFLKLASDIYDKGPRILKIFTKENLQFFGNNGYFDLLIGYILFLILYQINIIIIFDNKTVERVQLSPLTQVALKWFLYYQQNQ